ncbi:MAG TPA: hypothetical protein VK463_18975 [Desulfomonilaceae bacterium]|nr:hypothetical protein [Desulfomonilaceae bacterium]
MAHEKDAPEKVIADIQAKSPRTGPQSGESHFASVDRVITVLLAVFTLGLCFVWESARFQKKTKAMVTVAIAGILVISTFLIAGDPKKGQAFTAPFQPLKLYLPEAPTDCELAQYLTAQLGHYYATVFPVEPVPLKDLHNEIGEKYGKARLNDSLLLIGRYNAETTIQRCNNSRSSAAERRFACERLKRIENKIKARCR